MVARAGRSHTLPCRDPIPPTGAFLSGGGSIAVSMAVMNVATYGFTIVAARVLGPQDVRRASPA